LFLTNALGRKKGFFQRASSELQVRSNNKCPENGFFPGSWDTGQIGTRLWEWDFLRNFKSGLSCLAVARLLVFTSTKSARLLVFKATGEWSREGGNSSSYNATNPAIPNEIQQLFLE
jgi:hypothetical protein